MNVNLQAILKKIKALQARAADAASTEAEAAIAIRVANELLAKHNITLSELDVKADGVVKETWKANESNAKHRPPEVFAWKGIEALCNVKIWHSGATISIVGTPADVATALYFFDIVKNATESCYNAYMKTWAWYELCQTSSKRGISSSFKIGVASRLGRRMLEMARVNELIAQTAAGRGLMVVKNQLINQFLSDAEIKFCKKSSSKPDNSASYRAGQNAANDVALNPGIAGQRSTLALD